MKCYCISGLGADERIFSRLVLPGLELTPLQWLTPVGDEPIDTYADRMRAAITVERPILMGVSFGGMMAMEIAKKHPDATVVIISSVSDHRQIPLWIKVGGRCYPRNLFPMIQRSKWRVPLIERRLIGAETDEDYRLVNDFQEKADPHYLAWAIHTIARWKNDWMPRNFFHLHGGRDRMFPIRHVEPTHVVPDGGHLMVYNRADSVSRLIQEIGLYLPETQKRKE